MEKKFTYFDGTNIKKTIPLSGDLLNYSKQALTDYLSSFRYIQSQQYHIWRSALKQYHMSTYDRKTQIKTWQHNISIGLVRSFVDVLIAVVQEKPLTFIGTPVNKKGLENKDFILKSLNYVSDVTGFHTTIKKGLSKGLIYGEICFRVGYLKADSKQELISIVNNENIETVEVLSDDKNADYPYATIVSIFNIFPDPYNGLLRYITERMVLPYRDFINIFGKTLKSKTNESPFGKEEFYKYLPINQNNADFTDYGSIENEIHEKINSDLQSKDKFYDSNSNSKNPPMLSPTWATADLDTDVTSGLIEILATRYENKLVIHANGFPVYIGDNPFGFIPYVIKPATESETRFGEGIPYKLKGLEDVGNSFVNAYFDGARSLANPTFVANRNLLINDSQLVNGTPGGVLRTEASAGEETVRRLDKGGLNDYGIMQMINQIAQQITGISEYNLGQSAGERTASGALSVTQSSNKRMSPYISSFVDAISAVAIMWLELMKKYWTKDRFIYILDEDGNQVFEEMKNDKLLGGINITLQAEGLFGSTNELELQKLISTYQILAPSGFLKSPELAKEIIKKSGFVPSRFILDDTGHIKPDNAMELTADSNQTQLPSQQTLPDMLGQSVNPQINMGNGGEGQQ